jgi:2-polyprenyl-6-methoxyphenol hydroxylase-like FAD-dependent oxidoreductase
MNDPEVRPMADAADVVIVGGGIGGGSLAYALARAGLAVTVLEATTEYEDRVRGESMQAWGLKEARDLGVESVMRDAGAHIAPVWKQYMEGVGEAGEIPMSLMVEGIPGTLNLRHPIACQALVDAAREAGATVVRGASDIKLSGGASPSVSYRVDGDEHEIRTSLVVGADGRASTVRKQVGITLEKQEPITYIAGLLVDGLDGVPDDHDVLAGEGDLFFVLFHQGGGRARVYLVPGVSGKQRFTGPDRVSAFLSACAISCYPWSEQVAHGIPAGPVATYPGDDTWTATPYAEGVVLVGDAAGHNDPIIGQGLSIALRDARIVRDLVLDGARTPRDFAPYGTERVERMARLRFAADVVAVAQAEDADNRAARRAYVGERMATMDPEIMGVLAPVFAGPETMPDGAMDTGLLDRIRSA